MSPTLLRESRAAFSAYLKINLLKGSLTSYAVAKASCAVGGPAMRPCDIYGAIKGTRPLNAEQWAFCRKLIARTSPEAVVLAGDELWKEAQTRGPHAARGVSGARLMKVLQTLLAKDDNALRLGIEALVKRLSGV